MIVRPYDVSLKEDKTTEKMTSVLGNVEGTSEVVLIAAKSDVDYCFANIRFS